MGSRSPASAALHWTLLFLFSLVVCVAARDDDKPLVTHFNFTNQPSAIHWFDDSDTIIVTDREAREIWRSPDAGVTFDKMDATNVLQVVLNPHNNKVAVALGAERTHWITTDQGKSWNSFKTKYDPVLPGYPLSFHSEDPERIILNTVDATQHGRPQHAAVYTTNSFKKHEVLRDDSIQCLWAKERPQLSTGDKDMDKNRALCIVRGKGTTRPDQYRLVVSDDFFKREKEPELEDGRSLPGVSNMVTATKYILIARRAERSDELAMYTTTDTNNWHRALFSQERLVANGFTVMESTNYSIQVDVMVPNRDPRPASAMGKLYTSNSEGTNFIRNAEYTNRNLDGLVDFEKVQNVQGVYLTNIVTNHREVSESGADPAIASRITFDDGRSFQPLQFVGNDDKDYELQLHSVTGLNNIGRVYSTPAPGILFGVGSVSKYLKPWRECNLYVSDDGGLTWRLSLKDPHKYEVGDQGGILVAVWDHDNTRRVMYNLQHGREDKWQDLHFTDHSLPGVDPQILTAMPDATGKKFVLTTYNPKASNYALYTLDFNPLDLPDCKDNDFEEWTARYKPESDNSTCIMGHTQSFRRRKADAKCFVNKKYHEELPRTKTCECTEADFECDLGYIRSDRKDQCEPVDSAGEPKGDDCKGDSDTYEAPSGFRKIPGNTCEGGVNLAGKKVSRPCSGGDGRKPDTGSIGIEITDEFPAEDFALVVYLEYDSSFGREDDETIFMTTADGQLYVTHDHGASWDRPLRDEEIISIIPNRNTKGHAYFITPSNTVYYTKNRGWDFNTFKAPSRPYIDPKFEEYREPVLHFHEKNSNWLLWTGCAGESRGRDCEPSIYRSVNGGDDWEAMKRGIERCEFIYREERDGNDEQLEQQVLCVVHPDEDMRGQKTLASSTDWFKKSKDIFKDVINFATMSEFILVAKRGEKKDSVDFECSVDTNNYAEAKFPSSAQIEATTAYTVLDSSTHSVFLHVTINSNIHQEYGTIVKSNSNGTSYVSSLTQVNRNSVGYVDFEKMLGLEGVSIVNVVHNVDEVNSGARKVLKTKISHNDGTDWLLLDPPKKDSDGKPYECSSGKATEDCSLHLHGYTERIDPRDTYSSPSAVGMMMGTGNVGSRLGPKKDSDTFISRDGGITWKTAKKGAHMWEYGDQGSVIVLVEEEVDTDFIWYSLDEGDTWLQKHFSNDARYYISDLTTLPSDGSLKFLLWGKETGKRSQPVTIALDFSNIFSRQCDLKPEKFGDADADYELWTPKHPAQNDDCLFGHVAQYIRRKQHALCYNGKTMDEMERFHGIERNCTCKPIDLECDYNFERMSDNQCKAVPGAQLPNAAEICEKDKTRTRYREVSGYRKIPIDTCQGGIEDRILGDWKICPGREAEDEDRYGKKGLSGAALFFVIVIPILAAGGIGYYAWRHYESKFGRIRLGDGGGFSGRSSFDTNNPWIKWPVAAVSGVAAVLLTVPSILGGLLRWTRDKLPGRRSGSYSRRYTSRDSFARGRGSYQAVGTDESDLLGEESDEDA